MNGASTTRNWPRSIGVFADLIYRRDGDLLSANMAFGLYITALREQVERVVVFGRLDPVAGVAEHVLPAGVEFVPLPYYKSVADIAGILRALPGAARSFSKAVRGLDCVWIFGPHPVSLLFYLIARRRRVPVVLGVRQNQPEYMRMRLSGVKRLLTLPLFDGMEIIYRRLARKWPTFVAGDRLAEIYSGNGKHATVAATAFTVVDVADLVDAPVRRPLGDPIRLVTVGRLDPEKNPLLFAGVMRELARSGSGMSWHLTVIGDGPLGAEFDVAVAAAGVDEFVDRRGYVPYGPELRDLLGQSDIFVHISHTEGLPQVLIEAMAAGLPVVATEVGGVGALMQPVGSPLVRPGDATAMARSIERFANDAAGRADCAERGLRAAGDYTIQAQQSRLLDRVAKQLDDGARR